jgi:hypothetical protein
VDGAAGAAVAGALALVAAGGEMDA